MYNNFMSYLDMLLTGRSYGSSFVTESLENGNDMILNFKDTLSSFNSTYTIITTCVLLAICLAGCFFGYKLTRLFVSITGFIGGATIGSTIGHTYFGSDSTMTILAGVIGGLIVALLAYIIYKAGIFLLGFFLAFVTAISILPFSNELQFFCATFLGLIVGVLALRFLRPIIIIFTAVGFGASIPGLVISVCNYMNFTSYNSLFENSMSTLVICALGVIVQFLSTESESKKKSDDEEKLFEKEEYAPEDGEEEVVEEKEAAAPKFGNSKKKDNGKDRKKEKKPVKNNTPKHSAKKKGMFSSFMDAVDAGDETEPETDFSEYDKENTNEVLDNSDRPIETAEYTQIDK